MGVDVILHDPGGHAIIVFQIRNRGHRHFDGCLGKGRGGERKARTARQARTDETPGIFCHCHSIPPSPEYAG